MRPELAVLDVTLHGARIGTLTQLPGDHVLFAFNQDYLDNPGRPTLSLSFKDRPPSSALTAARATVKSI